MAVDVSSKLANSQSFHGLSKQSSFDSKSSLSFVIDLLQSPYSPPPPTPQTSRGNATATTQTGMK